MSYSKFAFADLIVPEESGAILRQYVREQHMSGVLASHGLSPRRKLLLHGPPGTGKSMAAAVLAGEMKLPLARVRLELLFSRLLGETAVALTEIFAEATRLKAVFLFDEFDALGRARESGGDVGEIRRVVGTFLQLLDADQSDSIFIAATNIPTSIDRALMRRFDDVIEFGLPTSAQIQMFLRSRLRGHGLPQRDIGRIAEDAVGLTLADLGNIADSTRKAALLDGQEKILATALRAAILEYRSRYEAFGQTI
ncbi:MAG: ATP-binding protein [Microcella sp.]|uniref:AAA family ATPase n=1 Tax=Microcella sp. TaxID=1913979 RepID=UPI00271D929C|nr:ATP-binding protein [Microcella sp.]MDO8337797.1 ATP-binding protein [Microcella sp.]